MDTNFQLPEAEVKRLLPENQDQDKPVVNQNKIELSYHAIGRLARILADIAENPTSSKEQIKSDDDGK